MLRTRIYTVLVLLPLFVAALFYATMGVWALFLMPLLLVGAWEWGGLAQWRPTVRMIFAGCIGLGAGLLWQFAGSDAPGARVIGKICLGIGVLFWLAVVPVWLAKAWHVKTASVLAVAGAVLLLPLWLALVQLHAQPRILIMLMAIVWLSDTAAYACGRIWGKHKLAVSISPGKTWEGVFGATLAVAVYYALVSLSGLAVPPILQGFTGCAVFLLLMALGIEGDLFESWVKRTAGVKDSGSVFPGHGGVLDRIDALTASMPAAALLLSRAL